GRRKSSFARQTAEMGAALLEVLVLVVARARGREEDDVARLCGLARRSHRALEVAAVVERHGALEVAGELLRGLADQVAGAAALRHGLAQPPEPAALEAAAEDEVHAALEGADAHDGG